MCSFTSVRNPASNGSCRTCLAPTRLACAGGVGDRRRACAAYWFPRDCPARHGLAVGDRTSSPCSGRASRRCVRRLHAIESGWLDRIRAATDLSLRVRRPRLRAVGPRRAVNGSRDREVMPISVTPMDDLLAAHVDAGDRATDRAVAVAPPRRRQSRASSTSASFECTTPAALAVVASLRARTAVTMCSSSAPGHFLIQRFGIDGDRRRVVGEGAWSRCFGFTLNGSELVIRFGRHVDDFQRDRSPPGSRPRPADPAGHRDRRGVRRVVLRVDEGARHAAGTARPGEWPTTVPSVLATSMRCARPTSPRRPASDLGPRGHGTARDMGRLPRRR